MLGWCSKAIAITGLARYHHATVLEPSLLPRAQPHHHRCTTAKGLDSTSRRSGPCCVSSLRRIPIAIVLFFPAEDLARTRCHGYSTCLTRGANAQKSFSIAHRLAPEGMLS